MNAGHRELMRGAGFAALRAYVLTGSRALRCPHALSEILQSGVIAGIKTR